MIREFKIEETEEGYRIEIKGDKEKLKRMLEDWPFGMPFGFGFRPGPHHGHRHGPHRFKVKVRGKRHGRRGHRGWGPPGGHWSWWAEHDEDDEASYSV